jgi:hypothetical protein
MRPDRFVYEGYELDTARRRVVCAYALGKRRFTEEIVFEPPGRCARAEGGGGDGHDAWDRAWGSSAADAAARILFLLAGISYYKTAAPPVVDLGGVATSEEERAFLRTFYVEGLAEFAYRNGLDLTGLEVVGPDADLRPIARTALRPGTPLVPFGAGIDSIVTADHVARRAPETSLFVVSRAGDRFSAIEDAAVVSGLPIVRADRRIDPSVVRSEEHGFLNGHVPVTGILSAVAVVAAVLGGHDAVVMSNERSASVPTVWDGDRPVNHQWSKSAAFESAFRRLLAGSLTPAPEYFSYLRARSELWVARELARLGRYHHVFRSCNRAFAIDPARRLDRWCGTCDKCCFVDLVLAPYLDAARLSQIFRGNEPLSNAALLPKFRALVGTSEGPRPFECVGDEPESRAAAVLAAARPDRAHTTSLQALAEEVRAATARWRDAQSQEAALHQMLDAGEGDFVPSRYRDVQDPAVG